MDRPLRIKVEAMVVVTLCVVSASLLTILPGLGTEDRSGSITSTIFEMYEDDGMVHFEFNDDYLFDRYLEESSTNLDELGEYLADNVTVGKVPHILDVKSCSAFAVQKDHGNGFFTGRNFDYFYSEPAIVHTSPDNGYESVSIVDMTMFGGTDTPLGERGDDTVYNALPYIPLDGVNEKGVFVCVNVVHNGKPFLQNDSDKPTIFLTSAIRLILDNAATTQEAVDLIMDVNLHTDVNYHLFVCDESGDSRSIEVVDDTTEVTSTDIMTNHYITEMGKDVAVSDSSRERYDTIEDALDIHDRMSEDMVKYTLISVQQTNADRIHFTRWSAIYDLENRCCVVWIVTPYDVDGEMDYDTPHRFYI